MASIAFGLTCLVAPYRPRGAALAAFIAFAGMVLCGGTQPVRAASAAAVPATSAHMQRAVAITIDDLPRGGDTVKEHRDLASVRAMTIKLLAPFRAQHIPFAGFVNAGRNVDFGAEGLRQILDLWLDAGAELGNHTYSHPNINVVGLAPYLADIEKGEPALREALSARGRTLRYFRHPFLFTGKTTEVKVGLQQYLDQHGYTVAPVTLDDSDYMFARLYMNPATRKRARREYIPYMESVVAFFESRSVEVVGREFPQILLIHASQLNADAMPELLAMFRRRGYRFVSLDEALADPAYKLPENYLGTNGFSWLHRWSKTRGMPPRGEPDPADWVVAGFEDNE